MSSTLRAWRTTHRNSIGGIEDKLGSRESGIVHSMLQGHCASKDTALRNGILQCTGKRKVQTSILLTAAGWTEPVLRTKHCQRVTDRKASSGCLFSKHKH
eukprot:1159699-Pelagomonas_calceolata.AAC.10